MDIILYITCVLILVLLVFIFNRIARYRNNAKDAWSNIDIFLKKRYDLIPILVNTVKASAQHEESTLMQVTEARSKVSKTLDKLPNQRAEAETKLSSSVNKVLFLQEAYPDLTANDSFLKLQIQLAEIEQDLERSRRYYNATVRENNTFGESFPINLIGNLFGFRELEFFSLDADESGVQPINL